jgi:glycosyltransferase involved in cell wall biosynthesis
MNVSAVIIAVNEEGCIQKCLDSVQSHVDEVVVIDGGSIDQTQRICRDNGCRVITNIFDGYFGNQRNFGIINSKGRWILSVDADEVFEESFWLDFPKLIGQEVIDAFKFPRKNYLDGVLDEKHYPDFQVRLFRRYCRWVLPVHEELVGCKDIQEVPYHIIHEKNLIRYTERNTYYNETIKSLYAEDFPGK